MGTEKEHPVGGQCLCFVLRQASRAVSRFYDDELRSVGLRTTQYSLLQLLRRSGDVRQRDLAELTLHDETTLTRNLRPLLDAGWITVRTGDDRREKWFKITATWVGEAQGSPTRVGAGADANTDSAAGREVAGLAGNPAGNRQAHGRGIIFFALIDAYTCFVRGRALAALGFGGTMASELEESARVGTAPRSVEALTPQARRLLEGPVLATLLRLAAPTVGLMLLQGVIAAGEAAYVGRLGSDALAGASLSFPLVMLMTTLSAGAYGGGVASGVARALGAGRSDDAARLAGTALTVSAILGLASGAVMLLGGRTFYAALGASGAALEAAVLYSDVLFLGAVPFWLFNAAASILRGGGNAVYPAAAGAVGGLVTLAVSPLVIFGAGPISGLGIVGAAWAVVTYNVGMSAVMLRAVWASGSPTKPNFRALVPRWPYAFEVLRVSVPSAGSTLLSNLTFIVLTALVVPFGTEATAGYGAGGRLEYLLIPIVFGVGSALVPLVAASDGAGDFERVRSLTARGAASARVGAGWWALPPLCFRGLGWDFSLPTPRSRDSAAHTWSGSARPTRSLVWGWLCISPRRGEGERHSRSWPRSPGYWSLAR